MNCYQLMNKDKTILEFACCRTEFDEPNFSEITWHSDLKPIGYTSIASFIERRKAPKHRRHIHELLSKFGCDDPEGFIKVTNAASLNDTFWVREKGFSLRWADISLYQNDFNELISNAAFDGIIPEEEVSATSPEFSTDGQYAKCWMREAGTITLYKMGSELYGIEPLSEFLASQLSAILCTKPIGYDIAFHNDKLISKCALFTDEKHGFAPASRIFKQKVPVSELLSFFEQIGSGDDFRRMCVLDALICNTDRHFGNFGVLFDNDTMKILGMAPVFDNNRSLFFSVEEHLITNLSYFARNAVPRLGTDFNVTANQLLTPEIRADLKNLSGFKFEQHPQLRAEQQRLDALSNFVNTQIDLILDRVPVRAASLDGKYNFTKPLDSKLENAYDKSNNSKQEIGNPLQQLDM